MEEKHVIQTDLNALTNKICEELQPMIAEMVKKLLPSQQPTATEIPVNQSKENEGTHDVACVEMANNVKLLIQKVDALADDDKKFNKMHEELDEHRKGLYRKLLSPILKNIVAQYSKVSDLYVHYDNKQTEENADKAALFVNLLREYKNLQLGLSDLLYDYDIEIVEPKAGEEFNPKMHKAIKTVPTENAELDRKIAACVTPGFKDVSANDMIVRYPEVEIFKLNS